jgi:hypothetical protein
MGRVTGAALAVAAPEAAAAGKVAARAGAGGRRPAADPRVSAPGSKAAQQRQAIEDLKARRPAQPHPMVPTSPANPPPTSPGGGPSMPSVPAMPAAAATGSGFLLGVFAWALGLAYLQHGMPGVRQFMAAKFLNQKGNLK